MAKQKEAPPTHGAPSETQTVTAREVGEFPVLALNSARPTPLTAERKNAAAELFLEGMKGDRQVPNAIPLVSIDHKEGKFKAPTGELIEAISGYPVCYFQTRKYYKKPFQAGAKGEPPDCWSADLLKPHSSSLEKQSETCNGCPMAEFGTGRDGRSQACGSFTWIFLVNPAFGNPPLAVVLAPPSSIRVLIGTRFQAGYFAQCQAKANLYEIVWTTFRLKRPAAGAVNCVIDPQMGPALQMPDDCESIVRLRELRNGFYEAMQSFRLQTPDEGSVEE
jgi:hypothetical protein